MGRELFDFGQSIEVGDRCYLGNLDRLRAEAGAALDVKQWNVIAKGVAQ